MAASPPSDCPVGCKYECHITTLLRRPLAQHDIFVYTLTTCHVGNDVHISRLTIRMCFQSTHVGTSVTVSVSSSLHTLSNASSASVHLPQSHPMPVRRVSHCSRYAPVCLA